MPNKTSHAVLIACLVGACLCVVVAAIVVPFGMMIWTMNAPAVPYSRMELMRKGMTQEEVRSILGNPMSIDTYPCGKDLWTYSRHTWASYRVRFSPEGLVTDFEHDY